MSACDNIACAIIIVLIIVSFVILGNELNSNRTSNDNSKFEHLFPLRDTTPRYRKLGGSSVELDPFEFEHFQSFQSSQPKMKKSEHCCSSKMEHCCGAKKAEHCTCASKMEHCCGNSKGVENFYVPPADPKKCGGYVIPAEFLKPADDIYVGLPFKNSSSPFLNVSSSFLNDEHFENGDVDRSWSSTIYTRSDEPHFNPTTPKPIFANMKYLQNRGKYKCYDTCERKNNTQDRSACMEECRRLSSTIY